MRWRIRHKMTFGLALVLSVMGLLLFGTLEGLRAYRETMRTMDSKHAELQAAQELQRAVGELSAYTLSINAPNINMHDLALMIGNAKEKLGIYQEYLKATQANGRDADAGADEQAFVELLQGHLNHLSHLAGRKEPAIMSHDIRAGIIDQRILEELKHTGHAVVALHEHIYTELKHRYESSEHEYRYSRGLILTTTVGGVLLMLALARLAYRWVVQPVRELHEKV